ncbi:MAG: hypothetical protein ABW178_13105 [Pseudoxanthomonas sp.]
MNTPSFGPNKTRLLSICFFAFVAMFTAVVWVLMRPYGATYFFPVHFLVGLGGPFLIYALGANRVAFWSGIALTAVALFVLNGWGHALDGAAPRQIDWSQIFAGLVGLALAVVVHHLYINARPKHGATPRM